MIDWKKMQQDAWHIVRGLDPNTPRLEDEVREAYGEADDAYVMLHDALDRIEAAINENRYSQIWYQRLEELIEELRGKHANHP